MTEREFDARLRSALAGAAMDELRPALAGADELEIEWSPDYLRRVTLLLNRSEQTARKAARPVWRRVLRMAACAILAAALLFGTLLTVSAEMRDWAWELVRGLEIKPASVRMALTRARKAAYKVLNEELEPQK